MKTKLLPSLRHGFTLIEILVVLAIISIIMFLAVPNMGEIIKGSKLTQAGDQVKFDLGLAQQVAVKDNQTVEVRFYQYRQAEQSEDEFRSSFTAYQMYQLIPDSTKPSDPKADRILAPIGTVKKLPVGIIIPATELWSSLCTNSTIANGSESVRGLNPYEKETNANYRSFQINPDGTTNLDTSGKNQWYVTLVDSNVLAKAGGSADAISPDNYICLQVDPYNGSTRWYQPN
jgi:uncharacterized protein (TIGR02596 family)